MHGFVPRLLRDSGARVQIVAANLRHRTPRRHIREYTFVEKNRRGRNPVSIFGISFFFFRSQRWKKNEFYEPGYGYLHFLLEQPFLFFPFLGEEARRPKAGRSNLRPDSH